MIRRMTVAASAMCDSGSEKKPVSHFSFTDFFSPPCVAMAQILPPEQHTTLIFFDTWREFVQSMTCLCVCACVCPKCKYFDT